MKTKTTPNPTLSHTTQATQQGEYWQVGECARRDAACRISTTTTQGQGRDVACDIYTEKQLIINNLQLTTKNTNPEKPHPGGGIIGFSLPSILPPTPPAIRAISWDSIVAKQEESASQLELVMDCLGRNYYLTFNNLDNLYDLEEVDAPETQLYYYHSDHLGSSSWITDNDGNATQHLAYLPYGESFVSQRLTGAPARYTFSAKEKDTETGYSYFGARYYESGLSVWLSVDPLSDSFPSVSSYTYCNNNPIIFKDPNGEFPWLVVWAVVEIGLTIYDAYETGSTLLDQNASTSEKIAVSAGFVAGALLPGGGYTKAAKEVTKRTALQYEKINKRLIQNSEGQKLATKLMKYSEDGRIPTPTGFNDKRFKNVEGKQVHIETGAIYTKSNTQHTGKSGEYKIFPAGTKNFGPTSKSTGVRITTTLDGEILNH